MPATTMLSLGAAFRACLLLVGTASAYDPLELPSGQPPLPVDDEAAIGPQTVESRLAVFPALPSGLAYELVLDGAEHSAFTDRGLPGDRGPRNLNHHRAILAVTTAFWDAWLRGDAGAREWLDGDGPCRVLAERDCWQRK